MILRTVSRRCGHALPLIVTGVAGCGGGAEAAAFLVAPEQFFSSTRVVAMAPVRPPAEVVIAEQGLARLDTLLDARLRDARFDVVPSAEYARIWQAVLERVGGIYDPLTGVPDDAKLGEARLQLADELELGFGADALLYPELWVEDVPFDDGRVEWHGVSESVVRTGPAIVGAVLGALAALGDQGQRDADLPSGMVRVLSLHVFIEDLAGVEMYRRAGGLRVVEKMGWHAGDWSQVEAEDLLGDPERNRRAVDVALEPLVTR